MRGAEAADAVLQPHAAVVLRATELAVEAHVATRRSPRRISVLPRAVT
jgi:hypothetical protein